MHKTLILFLATVAMTASGQGTLIGPATRNGGFEDGVAAPWSGINAASNSVPFASQGSWFGVVQSTMRTDSWQNVPVNPMEGRAFLVSFDARTDVTGFSSLSYFINTLNADGTDVLPVVTPLFSPALDSTAWNTYESLFSFPESWDGSIIRLGIGFSGGVSGGPLLTGFLDNVIVQQVPEPTSLALFLTGGILAANRLIRRRAQSRRYRSI